ncbi:MAG: SH3 domain-containing protein [Minwuia sp.]|nr:SH3 domain-containing protein [Minwuia sp.]
MLLPRLICLVLVLCLNAPMVEAVEGPAATEGSVTGLPLPRFVSIKAEEANLRAGPGQKYPVRWIYRRSNLPVQIVGEHVNWR